MCCSFPSPLHLPIQPQTLLKLHTPGIPQHHVQALPPSHPHYMLDIYPSPVQIGSKCSPKHVRIACFHWSSLSEVVAYWLWIRLWCCVNGIRNFTVNCALPPSVLIPWFSSKLPGRDGLFSFGRPYRSRTCDTLIKSQVLIFSQFLDFLSVNPLIIKPSFWRIRGSFIWPIFVVTSQIDNSTVGPYFQHSAILFKGVTEQAIVTPGMSLCDY